MQMACLESTVEASLDGTGAYRRQKSVSQTVCAHTTTVTLAGRVLTALRLALPLPPQSAPACGSRGGRDGGGPGGVAGV